jgi:hypothetical protein
VTATSTPAVAKERRDPGCTGAAFLLRQSASAQFAYAAILPEGTIRYRFAFSDPRSIFNANQVQFGFRNPFARMPSQR